MTARLRSLKMSVNRGDIRSMLPTNLTPVRGPLPPLDQDSVFVPRGKTGSTTILVRRPVPPVSPRMEQRHQCYSRSSDGAEHLLARVFFDFWVGHL